MPTPVIAIFDIGKTNKKLFLFDENYRVCFEKSEQLPEIRDEDGFPCEDIEALTAWVKNSFNELLAWHEFHIRAIHVSAHGAGLVHINEDGKPVAPLYNYLKPFPEKLKKKFYETYGGEERVAQSTASPVLGHLNSGLQLYWLKHERAEVFRKIVYSLHLPEYISYLFTNLPVSGITSIGCHTQLWDFTRNQYHDWVSKEGILEKLAPIRSSSQTTRVMLHGHNRSIGIGLHDSSAALIPYLRSFNEPFILLSTGTWNISLNPFNHTPLTAGELKKDCLCYLSYDGKPVKAARLFGGHEHEDMVHQLSEHFHKSPDYYHQVAYDEAFVQTESTFHLSALPPSFEEAYHRLIAHLVKKQIESTNLILQNNIKNIYVDGGFSKNVLFMKILANAYSKQDIKIYAAELHQASALGAALVIHDHWNAKPIPSALISLSLITGNR
jgi:L-fuculokinase